MGSLRVIARNREDSTVFLSYATESVEVSVGPTMGPECTQIYPLQ